MKLKLRIGLAGLVLTVGILGAYSISNAVVCFPSQGCTGIGTTTVSNVGKALIVSSTGPLIYTFGTAGGGSTTTINNAPQQFNFIASSTGSALSIASSTVGGSSTIQWILNLASYLTSAITSLSQGHGITLTPNPITATGTIALNTSTIYLDFSAANCITLNTSTGQIGSTCITTSSISINGVQGNVFTGLATSSGINSIAINGFSGVTFNILGSGNVTTTNSNGTTTISITGAIPIANGGTNATSAAAALTNLGGIPTSTYNASITIATAAPLGGGGQLTNGGTLNLTCTGCLTSAVQSLSNNSAAGGIDFSAASGTNITGVLHSLAISQFTGNIVNTFNGATGTVVGIGSINNGTGTATGAYSILAGANITIATTTTSTTITGSGGSGTPGGSDTYVQVNNGGAFYGTSTLTFSSTTQRLILGAVTSSLFIGTNANFATTTLGTTASSTTFSYTGATSSWTIPAGVTLITINALGAQGGKNSISGDVGGYGGSVTGTLSVTPGTTYYYNVGGMGRAATAGYGGGGTAGATEAGGGGGATWFSTTSTYSTSTVLLIAAGGGGSTDGGGGNGGAGGGDTGTSGGGTATCSPGPTGGTQTAGGTGGTGGSITGGNGSALLGGNGAAGASFAGGGGAGFFGGGGGGETNSSCGGSGAGGSSYASSAFITTSTTSGLNAATGTITITYNIGIGTTIFSTSTASLYVGGHVFFGNQNAATSSVSSCGGGPTINGVDTAGKVNVGSGVVTSCTVNFGQPFANQPICTLGVFSTAVTGGISSETTSSLVVGFSATLGGGAFNYICVDNSE